MSGIAKGRERSSPRGAMLLEVIVALTIFVGAVGVLASQLLSGMKMVEYSREQTRASQLADRIMSLLELDPTTMQRVFADQDTDGDFGEENPGWFWRVGVEPTETAGLGQVTVEVLHVEGGDPRSDIDEAKVVRALHMLKADPGKIDLARDFGMDETQIETFASLAGTVGLDPAALDPHAIVQMPPDQLLQIIPTLLPLIQQFMGGAGGAGGGLPPGLAGLLGQLQGGGGGGMAGDPFGGRIPSNPGNMSQEFLRNFIRQQLGDRISGDQLDGLFNNRGGAGGGGFNGPGQFPGNGPGSGNRPSADEMRNILRQGLGGQVSDAELDQLIDAYESNQNNQGDNFAAPPPRRGGGNRGGGDGGFGGRGDNGGQTINDFNNNRNNRGNRGNRGGRGGGGGGGRGGGGGGRGGGGGGGRGG